MYLNLFEYIWQLKFSKSWKLWGIEIHVFLMFYAYYGFSSNNSYYWKMKVMFRVRSVQN